MKLLIIRHGDPDYERDSLTPAGWKEAQSLAERLEKMDITAFYCSPLGRAKDTASLTLKKMGRSAVTYEWLREFAPRIDRPDREKKSIVWDWLPQDWLRIPQFLDEQDWAGHPAMTGGNVREEYRWVTDSFDRLLAFHGYVREGKTYRVERRNKDTLAFFCHFGLECVLLSHLWNTSPMILWHGLVAAPSSVTTVYTEERREGIAVFRAAAVGDISHLTMAGLQPSFAARFCECYGDGDRQD